MGNASQLTRLYDHMRPTAVMDVLESMMDSHFIDQKSADVEMSWNGMTTEQRILFLITFFARDGVDGEVARDLFWNLQNNIGAEDWIKSVMADV